MDAMNWALVVSGLNILLLLILLSVYVKNYKSIKSKFCMGLIIFVAVLLIQNIAALHFQFGGSQSYCGEVAKFNFVLNILEAFGISTLLYITLKPCM